MMYQGVVVREKFKALVVLLGIVLIQPISGFCASVTLAWDPSPDPQAVGYRIYYGVAQGNYTNSAPVGAVTTATVTGLVVGTTYYFAATAFDTNGIESIFSNETTYTPTPAVNQPPTLDALANVTINEGAAQQTVNLSGISSGAANETQTLVVTATSSNPTLIPNPTVTYTSPNGTGTIRFTPVNLAFGSATITVQVNDGGSSNNTLTRSFTVTVNPVNQAPTLNALANVTINEGAGQQTVNLAGISSGAANEAQTLVVTASSSDPTLIPNPTVTYTSPNATGTIRFTPVALAFGTATVTVQVNDGDASNNTVTRSFTVTVNSVNQAPTLNALANVSLNEGAGLQTVNLSGISSGAANETQTLIVTASSSNPALIPNPTVTYTSPNAAGTLAFTPVAGTGGSATITVTVNDGAANNNTATRTFTVSVNRTPVIAAIPDQSITVGSVLAPISFTISDTETAANSLTLTAASDNQSLLRTTDITFGGTGGNRTVTLTPLADQTGAAQITLTVSDGQASAQRTFQFTVNPRPLPPSSLRVVQISP
jgi:Fibronectin type III domain/Bacterial Ig domain